MPEYIVKTVNNRNLVIEAGSFRQEENFGNYEFLKEGIVVARVNPSFVFAIVEEKAWMADFYDAQTLGDEPPAPAPSEPVRSSVPHTAAGARADVPAPSPTVPDSQNYPIEHWKTAGGDDKYGFFTTRGFVDFPTYAGAEIGRKSQIDYPSTEWLYLNLSGATKVED
jgi:hypothetical protein